MIQAKYVPAIKSGRAWNGSHRDAGVIVHAVPPLPDNCSGDWFNKALCGSIPGISGNGWTKSSRQVNCQKCLNKLDKGTIRM